MSVNNTSTVPSTTSYRPWRESPPPLSPVNSPQRQLPPLHESHERNGADDTSQDQSNHSTSEILSLTLAGKSLKRAADVDSIEANTTKKRDLKLFSQKVGNEFKLDAYAQEALNTFAKVSNPRSKGTLRLFLTLGGIAKPGRKASCPARSLSYRRESTEPAASKHRSKALAPLKIQGLYSLASILSFPCSLPSFDARPPASVSFSQVFCLPSLIVTAMHSLMI